MLHKCRIIPVSAMACTNCEMGMERTFRVFLETTAVSVTFIWEQASFASDPRAVGLPEIIESGCQKFFRSFFHNIPPTPVMTGMLSPFDAVSDFIICLCIVLTALAMVPGAITVVLDNLRLYRFRKEVMS